MSAEGGGDVDYWDNLELSPIASHSGSISCVSKGSLYDPADFEAQAQLKFPEPFAGGCVSFDFSRLLGFEKADPPKCDTIMFGYYVKDELKVVKYFYDPRVINAEETGELDPCLRTGTVTWTADSKLSPNFYTSDFDDRKKFAPSSISTTNSVAGRFTFPHKLGCRLVRRRIYSKG